MDIQMDYPLSDNIRPPVHAITEWTSHYKSSQKCFYILFTAYTISPSVKPEFIALGVVGLLLFLAAAAIATAFLVNRQKKRQRIHIVQATPSSAR